MTRDCVEFPVESLVILLGKNREVDQRIGHATHGGHYDTDALVLTVKQQIRDTTETIGISKAAAAELVNFPANLRHLLRHPQRETLHDSDRFMQRRLF